MAVDRIGWSEDGQLLAVTGRSGSVHVFLSRLPHVSASQGCKLALLTSLTELTIFSYESISQVCSYFAHA